ncbi:hypothetical protein C7H62_2318 [Mesoflavibacter sp. HG96]|nr:hypothetical protein C7H62_2318 [Mesoflavibacter sp. HG96]QIJ92854.1 hypothetical protein C7H56_2318 [Mesoflavibacter sp. HG37]
MRTLFQVILSQVVLKLILMDLFSVLNINEFAIN